MVAAATRVHEHKGREGYEELVAAIRADFDPAPGDPLAREQTCRQCRESFWSWRDRWRAYCPACSAERLYERRDQQAERRGPIYARQVAGQLRHWQAERARLITTGEWPEDP